MGLLTQPVFDIGSCCGDKRLAVLILSVPLIATTLRGIGTVFVFILVVVVVVVVVSSTGFGPVEVSFLAALLSAKAEKGFQNVFEPIL